MNRERSSDFRVGYPRRPQQGDRLPELCNGGRGTGAISSHGWMALSGDEPSVKGTKDTLVLSGFCWGFLVYNHWCKALTRTTWHSFCQELKARQLDTGKGKNF